MKFSLSLNKVSSLGEIPGYWITEDYLNILNELDFTDAANSPPSELRELVEMALSDLESHEAAEVLLKYKLGGTLGAGQIKNLSHEMTDDAESEGNADMSLHYPIFNINQLLHASFGGVFPSAKATKLEFELAFSGNRNVTVTKEIALKAVCGCLSDKSPVTRLFKDQLNGTEPFGDTEHLVWELSCIENNQYVLLTSDYWINKEDIKESERSGQIHLYVEDEN